MASPELRICGHQTLSALTGETLTCELLIDHRERRELHRRGHTSWGELTAEEAMRNPHADPLPPRCGHQSFTKPLTCELLAGHSSRLHQAGNMKWGEAPRRRPLLPIDTSFGVDTKITGPPRFKDLPDSPIVFPPYEEPGHEVGDPPIHAEPKPSTKPSRLSRFRAWINPRRVLGIGILVLLFLSATYGPILWDSEYTVWGATLLILGGLGIVLAVVALAFLVNFSIYLITKEDS